MRFTAGGIDEMRWHLFTWCRSVTVEDVADRPIGATHVRVYGATDGC